MCIQCVYKNRVIHNLKGLTCAKAKKQFDIVTCAKCNGTCAIAQVVERVVSSIKKKIRGLDLCNEISNRV